MSEAPDQPEVKRKWKLISPLGCLVLVILVLIIGWGVSVGGSRMIEGGNSALLRTKSTMKVLQVATGHFRAEYNAFPIPATTDNKDVELRSEGGLIAALLGQDKSLNPREIRFVDLPMAMEGKFGLLDTAKEWRLVDRWGEMYYILMDTNLDNRISNPDSGNIKSWLPWVTPPPPPPPYLNSSTAIYSSGPDRDPKTWADNITTWR